MKKMHLSLLLLFFTLVFSQAVCAAQEYLLPDAATRNYSSEEIADMSVQLVCYAKNEIYARHGRMFVSQELKDYFAGCSWYKGTVSPDNFTDKVFNEFEMHNVILMAEREEELLPGGYVLDQPGYSFEAVSHYLQQKYGSDTETDIESIEGSGQNAESPNGNASPENQAVDPEVLDAYRSVLNAPDPYFPKYQTEEYVTVDYDYAFADMNRDGFPELLLAAIGGKNYTMYDGSTVIEYWPADVRVFSWSPSDNRLYTPEDTFMIGAAPVGGFRGAVRSSTSHDGLWYSTWSSGNGSGTFTKITIEPPFDYIQETKITDFEYTMVNTNFVPYEYENLTAEIMWDELSGEGAMTKVY